MFWKKATSVSLLVATLSTFATLGSSCGRANILLRRSTPVPLAFFTWPDSFKLGGKKPSDSDQGPTQGAQGEGAVHETRLRGGTSEMVLGPTTRPLSQALKSAVQAIQNPFGSNAKKEDPYATYSGQVGPLAEYICMLQAQEAALLKQASQCRAAAQRLIFIQQLLYTKVYSKGSEPKDKKEMEAEVVRWKATAYELHRQLDKCFSTAGKDLAQMLGEKAPTLPSFTALKSSELDSAVTPEYHSEEDEQVAVAKIKRATGVVAEGPTVRSIEKARVADVQFFSPDIEAKFRVATWSGFAVYGAIADPSRRVFEYPGDTELHLVWDIDQSKLVGEGTNDVELVIKCVLWWKEELKHDPGFIPSAVPVAIRKEFREYCDSFDLHTAFKNVMHLLVRPKIHDFVQQHPQAKWWSFTNKDREVDGQIVRDVSDEDGLVGKFQTNNHEVSGKQVVDANKYALQVLDECANEHSGIVNQERPIIGVRGQKKDLARVAKLILDKRQKNGEPLSRPVTIVLIDDRKQDAYGNCQANDPRILCHVDPYAAITSEQGKELVAAMEKILPSSTLQRFYVAFRKADPTHALVQCVEIMSDDQSMLLKRTGSDESTKFQYLPKVSDTLKLTPLPVFKRVVCRTQ